MKKTLLPFALLIAVLSCYSAVGQKKAAGLPSSWPPNEKHIAIDSFPSNNMINYLTDWGHMSIAVNSMPAGTDLGPMLVGLKNNSCQVPHWGYIIKGSFRLVYDTGKEVLLKTGDLFYMAPGHKGKVEEDLKLLDFSPQEEFKLLASHLEKKAAEMQQKK